MANEFLYGNCAKWKRILTKKYCPAETLTLEELEDILVYRKFVELSSTKKPLSRKISLPLPRHPLRPKKIFYQEILKLHTYLGR